MQSTTAALPMLETASLAREPAKGRVLLVDDDAAFCESLSLNLLDEGYEVTCAGGSESALEHLCKDSGIDAVLLDWRMPRVDGLALLRQMRERGHMMPVLFLTGLADNVHEEAALTLGAVDFINKSRSLAIILQRLALIIEGRKEAATPTPDVIRRGKLELKSASGRAFWDNHPVKVTPSEFAILRLLAEAPERDYSYHEIYELFRGQGWVAGSGEEGYRVNVRSLIKRIRQRFRTIDNSFDCIKNYSGYGYSWDALD